MTTEVIPVVSIQEITSGVTLGGDPPDGVASEESLYRGRLQEWLICSQAGEFSAPDEIGMRVEEIFWNLDATGPTVDIFLVDDNDTEYLVNSVAAASGIWVQTNGGLLVPPSFKIRVKADKAINAVIPVSGENTGVTGDGVSTDYIVQLSKRPVSPLTTSIVAGSVTFTDVVAGILTGTGGGGGSGTIDYATGAVTLTFNTPSDFGSGNAIAAYSQSRIGRVGLTQRIGWGQPLFSGSSILGRSNMPPSMARS